MISSNKLPTINNNGMNNKTQQVKKETNFDNLWGDSFVQNKNNGSQSKPQTFTNKSSNEKTSFDFFNSFGSNKKIETNPQQNNNTINFEEMFCETPTPSNNQNSNKELLDIETKKIEKKKFDLIDL